MKKLVVCDHYTNVFRPYFQNTSSEMITHQVMNVGQMPRCLFAVSKSTVVMGTSQCLHSSTNMNIMLALNKDM